MSFSTAPRRLYPVRIYTTEMILEGKLEPLGHLLDDLDDSDKTGMLIHDARIHPLIAASNLQPFALKQITANKMDFHLLYLADADDRKDQTLMRRTAEMIVYTSRFVIRGNFHMGGETRLRDFADGLLGTFLPVSEATIYALFRPAIDIPSKYPLLLVNKHQIRLYHPPAKVQAEE